MSKLCLLTHGYIRFVGVKIQQKVNNKPCRLWIIIRCLPLWWCKRLTAGRLLRCWGVCDDGISTTFKFLSYTSISLLLAQLRFLIRDGIIPAAFLTIWIVPRIDRFSMTISVASLSRTVLIQMTSSRTYLFYTFICWCFAVTIRFLSMYSSHIFWYMLEGSF